MTLGEFHFRTLWLAFGWLLIAMVLYLSLAPVAVDLSEGRDKVSHFIAFGTLMFWFAMLYPIGKRRALLAVGFVILGIAIEFLQKFTGYRTYEEADMVADAIGVALGWMLARTPMRHMLTWIDDALASFDGENS